MVKYRYLIIKSEEPAACYIQILEMYQLTGFISLIYRPKFVAIYDDVLVVGVPREVLRTVRAIVALLNGCRTVKVAGTSKRAKAIAASIRKAQRSI